jgi:hypothetical protein
MFSWRQNLLNVRTAECQRKVKLRNIYKCFYKVYEQHIVTLKFNCCNPSLLTNFVTLGCTCK